MIVNSGEILFPDAEHGEQPTEPPKLTRVLPGAERSWGANPPAALEKAELDTDLGPYHLRWGAVRQGKAPVLSACGTTPDGRRLLVRTLQYYDDPVRAVALLARGEEPFRAVAGTFVEAASPLPIRLRPPDGQGVFVAADGATLRYRARGTMAPSRTPRGLAARGSHRGRGHSSGRSNEGPTAGLSATVGLRCDRGDTPTHIAGQGGLRTDDCRYGPQWPHNPGDVAKACSPRISRWRDRRSRRSDGLTAGRRRPSCRIS